MLALRHLNASKLTRGYRLPEVLGCPNYPKCKQVTYPAGGFRRHQRSSSRADRQSNKGVKPFQSATALASGRSMRPGEMLRGYWFQSATALASGRSTVRGDGLGGRPVSIRDRSRERSIGRLSDELRIVRFQSATALASGRSQRIVSFCG